MRNTDAEYGRGIRTRNTDAECEQKLSAKIPSSQFFDGLKHDDLGPFSMKVLVDRPEETEILGTLQGLRGTS